VMRGSPSPRRRGSARLLHLHGMRLTSEEDEALALSSTVWIVLSRRAEVFQGEALRARGERLESSDRVAYWTDDYSNLFRLLGSPEHISPTPYRAPPHKNE
jgi:hypothetical protein